IAVAVGVVLLPRLAAAGHRAGAPPLKAVGPRSRRLLVASAGVLVVALAAGVARTGTGAPTWSFRPPAALAFAAPVARGLRFAAAARAESRCPARRLRRAARRSR